MKQKKGIVNLEMDNHNDSYQQERPTEQVRIRSRTIETIVRSSYYEHTISSLNFIFKFDKKE